jgi:hypothetical protein
MSDDIEEVGIDEQEDDKVNAVKGLLVDLPSGSKVAGYQLDNGRFYWIFTGTSGTKTVILLSEEATMAMAEVALGLIYPETTESA